MGFKDLFSPKPARRAHDAYRDPASQSANIEPTMAPKSTKMDRFTSGLCKMLHVQRRSKKPAQPTDAPATPAPRPRALYRFKSPAVEKPAKLESPTSPSPTAPPTTANRSSPTSAPTTVNSSSPTAPPTTADSSSPPTSPDTPPSTPGSDAITSPARDATTPTDIKTALAGLRSAEKLLQQRHAIVKPRWDTLTKGTGLEAFVKQAQAQSHAKNKAKTASPKAAPEPTTAEARTARSVKVERHLPAPTHATANDACAALVRPQLLRDLAYRAVRGCPDAVATLVRLNAHFASQSGSDLILNFDGTHVRASHLGPVEHTWVARFNAVSRLEGMVLKKQLGVEDFEDVVARLFPGNERDLLEKEYFAVFVTCLQTEGSLTQREAKSLAKLCVGKEEFEQGSRFTGEKKESEKEKYHAANVAIPTFPPPTPTHLRTLLEAAAYALPFHAGFFFPNPRAKVLELPSSSRAIQRGKLVVELLQAWESGTISDFGIPRAVRATFIPLPGQASYSASDLPKLLYARVAGSGLPISRIPEILALHPEYDGVCVATIMKGLEDQAKAFEMEEAARLAGIEVLISTFENMRKKDLGWWRRVKKCLKVNESKEVEVFDPFAVEE